MNHCLYILLRWANSDPRWALLIAIIFLPYGVLTLPKSIKRYGNKSSLTREGREYFAKNHDKKFYLMAGSSDLNSKQFAVIAGILFSFGFFGFPFLGLFMAFGITIVYSIILFMYYFRWTDIGYKYQEEEKKKKEEKEQKKKEEDDARKKKYL